LGCLTPSAPAAGTVKNINLAGRRKGSVLTLILLTGLTGILTSVSPKGKQDVWQGLEVLPASAVGGIILDILSWERGRVFSLQLYQHDNNGHDTLALDLLSL